VSIHLHPRRSACFPVVLTAAVGLALAGCGQETALATTPATAPAADPTAVSEQAVQWTDSVCGALVPVTESLASPPGFDLTAPAAGRDAYLAYVAQARAATDQALDDIAAAGPAPVDGGQQVTEEVRSDVTELRDDLADARTQLEQADANDAAAIGASVVAAGNIVGAVANSAQALSALDGNPRLDAAFEQAQSCQRLRAVQTPGR
jgi:hypothetical protein